MRACLEPVDVQVVLFGIYAQKGSLLRIRKTIGHQSRADCLISGKVRVGLAFALASMMGKGAAARIIGTTTCRVLVMLVGLLVACTRSQQYDHYIQGWIGLSTDQVIRSWGPPQKTAELPDGATVIEYREQEVERVAVPVTGGGRAVSVRFENRVAWCVTRFTAKHGVVESSRFEGTACQAP